MMIKTREVDRRPADRWKALRHYFPWIVLGAFSTAACALVFSLLLPRIYRATTYLLISESRLSDPSKDTNLQQMAMLQTFVPFVDNDALIDDSLRKLKLDRPPYSLTVDLFRRRDYIDVRAPKATRLLEIDIEFPDARLAAALANELAQGAMRFNDKLNATDTVATQQFLRKQLDEAQSVQNDAATRRLAALEEGHIEDRDKELDILLGEKESLSVQLQKLRQDLVQTQSRSQSLERALTTEPELISLKRSVNSSRLLEAAAGGGFPEGMPLTVTEDSLNQTREEIRKDFLGATAERAAASAGIEAAGHRLQEVNREISELISRITALRARIEAADQNYRLAVDATESASREYHTASVTVSSKSQDIKQIAPALVPERPVRPTILINTLMGFFAGLLTFSLCALGLQSYRDVEVREKMPMAAADDAEIYFTDPPLARR